MREVVLAWLPMRKTSVDVVVGTHAGTSWLDMTELQLNGIVRIPYYTTDTNMLAKITSKNQLTLPKSITQPLGPIEYFDVVARNGQIILTPVRIQRGDAVRAKLAELNLTETDISDAVIWAHSKA